MQTECSAELFAFAPVSRREVVGSFDGGAITSDAGALLLRATDRTIELVKQAGRAPAALRAGIAKEELTDLFMVWKNELIAVFRVEIEVFRICSGSCRDGTNEELLRHPSTSLPSRSANIEGRVAE